MRKVTQAQIDEYIDSIIHTRKNMQEAFEEIIGKPWRGILGWQNKQIFDAIDQCEVCGWIDHQEKIVDVNNDAICMECRSKQ